MPQELVPYSMVPWFPGLSQGGLQIRNGLRIVLLRIARDAPPASNQSLWAQGCPFHTMVLEPYFPVFHHVFPIFFRTSHNFPDMFLAFLLDLHLYKVPMFP